MAVLSNFWVRILDWFQDHQSRTALVRGFNQSAKEAYIQGVVPVVLDARIAKGNEAYRHKFSKILEGSGFRITVRAGKQLTKREIVNIGETILSNDMLVRRMVVLGWDTLQVHCDIGNHGCQWQLHDYIMIGV